MNVIQASCRFPLLYPDLTFVEHVRNQVRDEFGRELVRQLAERGGIVGPVHEQESTQDDWLWDSGSKVVEFTVYAQLTDLPDPETYRLLGGPADGRIVLTGGVRTWRVPVFTPVIAKPFDVTEIEAPHYAEYERQGDTQVYLYRRYAR